MEAKLKQIGEISVVQIQGSLQIEKTQAFKDVCEKHFAGQKVVFNMNQAHFVGSSGIQHFIDAMKLITSKETGSLKLVGLKPEFKRIFSNLEIQGVQIYESEVEAMMSFTSPAIIPAMIPVDSGASD